MVHLVALAPAIAAAVAAVVFTYLFAAVALQPELVLLAALFFEGGDGFRPGRCLQGSPPAGTARCKEVALAVAAPAGVDHALFATLSGCTSDSSRKGGEQDIAD